MASRRMTDDELAAARGILHDLRQRITEAGKSDPVFTFALRRYLYKNLSYDERGTPAQRTKLKLQKLIEQAGKCPYAKCSEPDRIMTKADEPELDRIDPVKGYTSENTTLVHHGCHRHSQDTRGYC
jgi:hypothetical protein